jgi:hypothetical protein
LILHHLNKGEIFVRLIAFVMMLVLASAASATSERITTGPYTISFDLNTSLNYTMDIQPAKEENDSVEYVVTANIDNQSMARIAVIEYKNPVDSTLWTIKRYHECAIHDHKNSSVSLVKIDETDAVLTTSVKDPASPLFWGEYWPDSEECDCGPVSVGRTQVEVFGNAPQNITESLLGTLGVRRSGPEEVRMAIKSDGAPAKVLPAVKVSNQNVGTDGVVTIDEVDCDGPGWVVIHADQNFLDPIKGVVVGYTRVNDGVNRDVVVKLNMAKVTRRMWAAVHKDGHSIGTFEYPGRDLPFTSEGKVVAEFFTTWPTQQIFYPEDLTPTIVEFLHRDQYARA